MHIIVIFTILISGLQITHIILLYSLYDNEIDDAGAQALAEGLQHCTNLRKLK